MKHLYFLLILFTFFSCTPEKNAEQNRSAADFSGNKNQPGHPVDSATNPFHGKTLSAEAYHSDSLGWGYVISIDGKKTINQPHIPGIPGTKGFKTKEQALKTANFVIYKIQHNMLPPSVTPEELDSLGVLE